MEDPSMEVEALCWLRFGKKLPYICTEGGHWNADVIGLNDDFVIEVEIKRSVADFKRDFTNKRAKHFLYSNAEGGPSASVPNYFYFYVLKSMEEKVLEILKENNSKAGVAVYDPLAKVLDGRNTRIAKRPTKLHDEKPSANFKKTVLQRMGSELCGRYLAQKRFMNEMINNFHLFDEKLVETIKNMVETPDAEAGNDPAPSS